MFCQTHEKLRLWVVRIHFFLAILVWPLVILLPETYGPAILETRARKLRASGQPNAYASHELHHLSINEVVKKHILRPARKSIYWYYRRILKGLTIH